MQPPAIVEDLDVFENAPLGFPARVIFLPVDQLGFERVKETLCHRVVPAIAFSAHRADRLGILEQSLVVVTRVLAPAV